MKNHPLHMGWLGGWLGITKDPVGVGGLIHSDHYTGSLDHCISFFAFLDAQAVHRRECDDGNNLDFARQFEHDFGVDGAAGNLDNFSFENVASTDFHKVNLRKYGTFGQYQIIILLFENNAK
jgi:hypothetical protein